MIVAIHQPHFLPWQGYMDRMAQADLFILLDHVQFERQNYQNRVQIKTGQGAQWITVPVNRGSQQESIIDKTIDYHNDGDWARRMVATLQYAYQGTPYFSMYAPTIRDIFNIKWKHLIDLNLELFNFLRDSLGIQTPVIRSSELDVPGQKSELVLNLCRAVKADTFLGGLGGSRRYLDQIAFEQAGINVIWHQFSHPIYKQHPRPETFIEGVSAIDLLFNCGPESGNIMRGETNHVNSQRQRVREELVSGASPAVR